MKRNTLLFFLVISSFHTLAQYNFDLKGNLQIGNNSYSNIWGYTQNNKEYALLGCTGSSSQNDACAIINITNPSQPVTLFKIAGPTSEWREIRTWQHYAYITAVNATNTIGVTIVDLQYLPDSIKTKQFTSNGLISKVHSLHIDNGYLYLYGARNNTSLLGALMINLSDPWNPVLEGSYTTRYVHDGIVRNNKLYACEIYDGTFSIIDVSDKTNPIVLNSQVTPFAFTHNSWLSSNNKYLYTTDEKSNAFVASYDVSDPLNIIELDRYRHLNANGSIPHNTYILNDSLVTGSNTDFLFTSYYTDGITIVDAARPDNLVEVAHYDTSPFSGDGFHGAWGVYPYFNSGNIIVSDIELGLFVLKPNFKRACYLEGIVSDAASLLAIPNISVAFTSNGFTKVGKLSGEYKTGIVNDGVQEVVFSAQGYKDTTIFVNLTHGQVIPKNLELTPMKVGIDKKEINQVKVFPSIVEHDLYIQQQLSNKLHVVIFDIEGKKMLDQIMKSNKEAFDLSRLNTGNYIIHLYNNGDLIQIEKIVKK